MTYEFYHNKLRLLSAARYAEARRISRLGSLRKSKDFADYYTLSEELADWQLLKTEDHLYVSALSPEKFPVKIFGGLK